MTPLLDLKGAVPKPGLRNPERKQNGQTAPGLPEGGCEAVTMLFTRRSSQGDKRVRTTADGTPLPPGYAVRRRDGGKGNLVFSNLEPPKQTQAPNVLWFQLLKRCVRVSHMFIKFISLGFGRSKRDILILLLLWDIMMVFFSFTEKRINLEFFFN